MSILISKKTSVNFAFSIATLALALPVALHGILSSTALADDLAGGKEIQTEEIVVTASRIPLKMEQIGSAVSIITSRDIEQGQSRFVSDLLRHVPGVAVNQQKGGLAHVRIRGSEANHTLVIIDGIEMNNPAGGSAYNFSQLMTADIERIEIIRGSQSALWGSDAIGGVINIITKSGKGKSGGYASIEGGSFRTRQIASGVNTSHNDVLTLALNAARYRTDGFSSAAEKNGNHENDGSENDTFSGKIALDLSDALQLRANGRYVNSTTDNDNFDFVTRKAIDGDNATKELQRSGRIALHYTPYNANWTYQASLFESENHSRFFAANRRTGFSKGNKLKHAFQATGNFESSENTTHAVTFLGEREKESMAANFLTQDKLTTVNKGFAGEYNLAFAEALFFSAGLRYDSNDRFKNAKTYRLSAAYLINATKTRLHSSVGTGVQNPTLDELYGFTANFVGNPDLQLERSKSLDFGIEQKFFAERITTDVTFFRNDITDEITGFGATVDNIKGTSRTKGVEISADMKLFPDFTLAGHYTYSNAKTSLGAQKVRRPKHNGAMTMTYGFLDDKAETSLNIVYTGKSRSINNTNLPSYVLVKLSASYAITEQLEIYGRGENLLNADYEEVDSYGTAGRAGYVGLRVSF